jgi:hypothetical protein
MIITYFLLKNNKNNKKNNKFIIINIKEILLIGEIYSNRIVKYNKIIKYKMINYLLENKEIKWNKK